MSEAALGNLHAAKTVALMASTLAQSKGLYERGQSLSYLTDSLGGQRDPGVMDGDGKEFMVELNGIEPSAF